MKTIKLTQSVVNQHFIANTVIEKGWTLTLDFPTKEQKHRAMLGILEVMVGVCHGGIPINGYGTVEYGYDHARGYNKYIGRFPAVFHREFKRIHAFHRG